MAPLTEDLRSHGLEDLVLSVPGIVGALPLAAACRVESDGTPHHLIEDFRSVSLTPSLATWIEQREPVSRIRRAATVMTEQSMPQAAAPVRVLSARLRSAGATVQNLSEAGTGRRRASAGIALEVLGEVDLVHFAAHGRFTEREPDQSGLVLSNGEVLSVEKLLAQSVPSPATLVVLAACSSGRTTPSDLGGEWQGLSGAMLRIGVRNVIAALWDVETASTLRLIDSFYDSLLGEEKSPAISLGMAMREQLRLGRAGEKGEEHVLTGRASEQTLARLRRLCASPLFWSGLVAMQAG